MCQRRVNLVRIGVSFLIGGLIVTCGGPAWAAGIFRVDAASTATTPDGQTWSTAYKTLQTGVDAANAASGGEVWVKAGTYIGTANPVVTMKAGVSLYGGFAGTETSRSQRNRSANVTAIDGQSTRSGVIGASNAALDGFTIQNCLNSSGNGGGMYNESCSPTVANCIFSGNKARHTTMGITTGSGGGMYNTSASPTITNCVFTGNNAGGSGGAICISSGSPVVTNCVFRGNVATNGAGMWNSSGSLLLTNCVFTGNSGTGGGGLYNSSASPAVKNCIFWGDTATSGAEIYNTSGTAVLTYCCVQGGYTGAGNITTDPLFVVPTVDLRLRLGSPCIDSGTATGAPSADLLGVTRPQGAGVDMGAYEGSVTVDIYRVNSQNTAGPWDGSTWATGFTDIQSAVNAATASANGRGDVWVKAGTYIATANPVLTMKQKVFIYGGFAGSESTVGQRNWSANTTVIDGQNARTCVYGANYAALDGFTITRGKTTYYGGGVYNSGTSPTLANCIFTGNTAPNYGGGGMYNTSSSSPAVLNCVFTQNSASLYGGGIYNASSSSPVITNCIFTQNTASRGGAIENYFFSSPILTNCLFIENSASQGGGLSNYQYSSPVLTNCTFNKNKAAHGIGGALLNYDPDGNKPCTPTLTNCILWGDTATANPELAYVSDSTPKITYSCVQGGYTGTGNVSSDPLFVAAPANLRLRSGSPCLNTATATGAPATDIQGVARPQDTGVDMGVYEKNGSDTTVPVITECAPNQAVSLNDSCQTVVPDFTAGVAATDSDDATLIVTQSPAVGTAAVVGSTTVSLTVSDAAGNFATCTATLTVADTTAPVVTLNGPAVVTVECPSAYADAGATAADNCGGNLTSGIVITNPVNVNAADVYTVTHSVTDSSGNTGTAARTVTVVDTTPPIITLLGVNPVTLECHTAYTDAGATANDTCAGDLSSAIVVSNPVNVDVPGTYAVLYSVSDGSNTVEAVRTVNVVVPNQPVITLLGASPITVECHTSYTDAGATAVDGLGNDLTGRVVVTNPVNVNAVGVYAVLYNVTDNGG